MIFDLSHLLAENTQLDTTYRHITNLRTPLDAHDRTMLVVLEDYRLGDPVKAEPAKDVEPVDVPTMKANGIIGLYVPLEAVLRPQFVRLTGWEITPDTWEARPAL